MNTHVSFEIAKLLKEKGFDKRVKGFYDTEKELHENYVDEMNTKGFANRHLPKGEYSAPTIAEVIMWLFESHNIWIYLTREPITNTFGPVINTETKSIYFNNQSTVSRITGQKYDPWYNKPENGYQKAIEYVLTEMI